MRYLTFAITIFGLSMSSASCAYTAPLPLQSAQPGCSNFKLKYKATVSVDHSLEFNSERFGGISGIDFDPNTNRLFLISDAKGHQGAPRFYSAKVEETAAGEFYFELVSSHQLGAPFGVTPDNGQIDAESIRVVSDSEILWTSEGGAGVPPALVLQSIDGEYVEDRALPDLLLPGDGTGPRPNGSLEALEVDNAGQIWLGLEAPLIENGGRPSLESGAQTTVLELSPNGSVKTVHAYPLSAIPRQVPGKRADNGLAEILQTTEGDMLFLERAGQETIEGEWIFSSKLYCASIGGGNDESLASFEDKELVIDLTDLVEERAGNFEAMTFWQPTPQSPRRLILAADNNFADGVPTSLIILEEQAP